MARFISLFAGVGGFDLGMERAGHECVAMVEYDRQAAGVLAHRFPGVSLFCDVRQVSADDLPDADFITYGFPCQDLSMAGKREGLNGDRSGLFFEATRIIRGLRKRGLQLALAENVAGLLSADDGGALARCICELRDIGARDVGWRVLDSQWCGVAQRRRRVFLVADFAGERADQVLALTESLRGHPAPSREAGQRVTPTVTGGAPFSRTGNERLECEAIVPALANTLTKRMYKGINSTLDERQTPVVCPEPFTAARHSEYVPGIGTLRASGGDNGGGSETICVFQPRIGRNGRGYAGPGEPVPALSGANAGATSDMRPRVAFGAQNSASQGDSVSAILSPTLDKSKVPAVSSELSVRRLTPTECERLQGFPDDWTAERRKMTLDGNRWIAGDIEQQSDTPRYKQLGNAVTVNVAEWIGRRIRSTSEAGK